MRILYVEDDMWMAKTVEAMLKQANFEFDTADCGKEAIDRAVRAAASPTQRYDLILLDIMLPDIDGYEVINRIRGAGIDTPFLVQTALLERGDNGASLGVTEYLVKPFNKSELIQGINTVVNRANQVSAMSLHLEAKGPGPRREAGEEKRKHRRFVSLKSAEIVGPVKSKCVVLNLSYGGATLCLLDPDQDIPAKFILDLQTGPVVDCEVRWRLGDKIGIEFI